MKIFIIIGGIIIIILISLGIYFLRRLVNKYISEYDRLSSLCRAKEVELVNLDVDIDDKELELHKVERDYEVQKKLTDARIVELEQKYLELEKKSASEYETIKQKQKEDAKAEVETYIQELKELSAIHEDKLEKIKKLRESYITAKLREEEIENNKDAYRLMVDDRQKNDIQILEDIKDKLHNPEVVSKIIWSNYYQPIAKKVFPVIIGKPTATGIYKITSLTTGRVYVGQAVDLYRRFNDHAKAGLGIGNKKNKLYTAMQKEGLDNFTFEVLTECKPNELNEFEAKYIELYNAKDYGLNTTAGNNV